METNLNLKIFASFCVLLPEKTALTTFPGDHSDEHLREKGQLLDYSNSKRNSDIKLHQLHIMSFK